MPDGMAVKVVFSPLPKQHITSFHRGRRTNLDTTFTKEEQKSPRYELNSVREYKIGHTTYIVKTYFDLECGESLEDLLQRLVTKEICKAMSS